LRIRRQRATDVDRCCDPWAWCLCRGALLFNRESKVQLSQEISQSFQSVIELLAPSSSSS
jgi:hypothetical protein